MRSYDINMAYILQFESYYMIDTVTVEVYYVCLYFILNAASVFVCSKVVGF